MRNRFILLIPLALGAVAACKSAKSEGFPTPEAAMKELADTIGTQDDARIERLFGKDGPDMLRSGDDVADRDDVLRVQKYIHEKVAFEDRGADTKIALLGDDGWPFPIPLVHEGDGWHFDVEAGVEELANRRVGRNEISTLASLHAYVDAQREYASEERDGRPKAYAKQIFSNRGKHDGLYWPTVEGEPDSPLGPLMAEAANAGYTKGDDGPEPFHGYYFRVLLVQGSNAPGGAKHFADEKGNMTRGFAMIAWPAKYGTSGVMTFLVGPQGIVYQKDLGEKTDEVAGKIQSFDPDDSWDPTGD